MRRIVMPLLLLLAALLVTHVEDVLQLGMRGQHVAVEVLDDVVAVLGEDRSRALHGVLGFLGQHYVTSHQIELLDPFDSSGGVPVRSRARHCAQGGKMRIG